MREFEPIDDLNEEDFEFWLDITTDLLSLDEFERRATQVERYYKVRNHWRYAWLKKRRRR